MFETEFSSTWCHHQETGFTFTVNCCGVSSIICKSKLFNSDLLDFRLLRYFVCMGVMQLYS